VREAMTDTPLMRAARALVLKESGTDSFDGLEPELQEQVIESVKVVLEAVREPSEAMRAAASRIPHARDAEIFQAMIDEALSER